MSEQVSITSDTSTEPMQYSIISHMPRDKQLLPESSVHSVGSTQHISDVIRDPMRLGFPCLSLILCIWFLNIPHMQEIKPPVAGKCLT